MSIALTYSVENTDNIKIIKIVAPIDFSFNCYQHFRDVYKDEQNTGTKFVIDFINTTLLSVSALAMILLLKDHVDLLKGELILVNPKNKQPLDLLNISKFDHLFNASLDENSHKNHIRTMPQHGKYSISTNNQLLTVKAYDDWNIETVISCFDAFRDQVKTLKHESWSCLVDLSQWNLGPPEMLNEIKKLNIWSEKNNQKFEAVIVKDSVQKHLLQNSHQAFNSIKSKFFDNHDDALSWLSTSQRLV